MPTRVHSSHYQSEHWDPYHYATHEDFTTNSEAYNNPSQYHEGEDDDDAHSTTSSEYLEMYRRGGPSSRSGSSTAAPVAPVSERPRTSSQRRNSQLGARPSASSATPRRTSVGHDDHLSHSRQKVVMYEARLRLMEAAEAKRIAVESEMNKQCTFSPKICRAPSASKRDRSVTRKETAEFEATTTTGKKSNSDSFRRTSSTGKAHTGSVFHRLYEKDVKHREMEAQRAAEERQRLIDEEEAALRELHEFSATQSPTSEGHRSGNSSRPPRTMLLVRSAAAIQQTSNRLFDRSHTKMLRAQERQEEAEREELAGITFKPQTTTYPPKQVMSTNEDSNNTSKTRSSRTNDVFSHLYQRGRDQQEKRTKLQNEREVVTVEKKVHRSSSKEPLGKCFERLHSKSTECTKAHRSESVQREREIERQHTMLVSQPPAANQATYDRLHSHAMRKQEEAAAREIARAKLEMEEELELRRLRLQRLNDRRKGIKRRDASPVVRKPKEEPSSSRSSPHSTSKVQEYAPDFKEGNAAAGYEEDIMQQPSDVVPSSQGGSTSSNSAKKHVHFEDDEQDKEEASNVVNDDSGVARNIFDGNPAGDEPGSTSTTAELVSKKVILALQRTQHRQDEEDGSRSDSVESPQPQAQTVAPQPSH